MLWFGRKKKKRAAEEAKKAEEARLAEEAKRAEEARLAEEAKKAEEARKAAEAKQAEEARLAAEAKKAEEAAAKAAKEAAAKEAKKAKEPTAKEVAPVEEAAETPAAKGKFEIKRTGDERYMFNVRAGNTQIIASSQIYSSMTACKNGIASVGANAPIAAIEDQTLQTINEEKCPKFQIYLDKGGKYRFNLIATNGQNILSCSQGYKQKASCKNGIKSVIANANAPTEILRADEDK